MTREIPDCLGTRAKEDAYNLSQNFGDGGDRGVTTRSCLDGAGKQRSALPFVHRQIFRHGTIRLINFEGCDLKFELSGFK